MNHPELVLVFASLLSVAVVWLDPEGYGQDAVSVITLAAVAFVSPLAALWLIFTIAATLALMAYGARHRAMVAAVWSIILSVTFLVFREDVFSGSFALFLGGAYFTLRHMHVILDWWLRETPAPSLRQYARYHLLAPVMVAGPIHRLPNFERTVQRRRWDASEFFAGAERALFGAVLAFVVAEFLYAQILQELPALVDATAFRERFLRSALDWIFLYIAFSGLTDLALGLSAMMGLKLEENFNRPYMARDLIDFWQRWHMTLSHWCRDYVFLVISTRLRSPALGVFAAMTVLGLWHETSVYYVLWAFWQALGIVGVHLLFRNRTAERSRLVDLTARVGSFTWLALASPVCLGLLDLMP